MNVKTFWDWLRYAVVTLGGRRPSSHFLPLFQSSCWGRNTPIFEAAQHDDSFCGTVVPTTTTVMTRTPPYWFVIQLVAIVLVRSVSMAFLSCCVNQTATENKTRRLLSCVLPLRRSGFPPFDTLNGRWASSEETSHRCKPPMSTQRCHPFTVTIP